MIKQEIFKSSRYFTLFDVLVSHSQLLLRSQKTDDEKCNIDIIFFDTVYIQLFGRLNSVCIKKIDPGSKIFNYDAVEKYLRGDKNNLFEIESNGELYYIAASFVKIFENQLDFSETSLNFDNSGREKEIASSITK